MVDVDKGYTVDHAACGALNRIHAVYDIPHYRYKYDIVVPVLSALLIVSVS